MVILRFQGSGYFFAACFNIKPGIAPQVFIYPTSFLLLSFLRLIGKFQNCNPEVHGSLLSQNLLNEIA